MENGHFNWTEDYTRVFEHWTIWVAIASAIIIGSINGWKKIKKSLREDNFINLHSEIHETLTELRVLTDSAKAQIIQFHNGEYFMDGISMRKFSLTHESVAKGVESDGSKIQGYLCSMFLPLLLMVTENLPKIRYTADLKESYVKQYFESRNTEAFSVLPIKINNMITGFVINQWCSSAKLDAIDDVQTQRELLKCTNSITVQLSQQKR
jgi:hypothetical protein